MGLALVQDKKSLLDEISNLNAIVNDLKLKIEELVTKNRQLEYDCQVIRAVDIIHYSSLII